MHATYLRMKTENHNEVNSVKKDLLHPRVTNCPVLRSLQHFPSNGCLVPLNNQVTAFRNQTFPYYAFILACLSVNTTNVPFSMSSRKRI